MDDNNKKFTDIDRILRGVFNPESSIKKLTLSELFKKRMSELNIPVTTAQEILNIERKTLKGILEGTLKRVDFTNLFKVADFLQISNEETVKLYLETLQSTYIKDISIAPEKVEFIKKNFDLVGLKKAKFINSVSNYSEIEKKINAHFGLKNITEYTPPKLGVAFSVAALTPKNDFNRNFWLQSAIDRFKKINNPNNFDRKGLIEFFPQIRWYSTDVELGLEAIIKILYKLGVTVLYLPTMPNLQIKGATLPVNEKPCIVLSNYMGYYPTLWFVLIHELFHVLFDWEDIKEDTYHISIEHPESLPEKEKEKEADDFAREYLFSKEKIEQVLPFINNPGNINQFALDNNVHNAFVYVFYAKDRGAIDRMAWARARKNSPISLTKMALKYFPSDWEEVKPVDEYVNSIKNKIYN